MMCLQYFYKINSDPSNNCRSYVWICNQNINKHILDYSRNIYRNETSTAGWAGSELPSRHHSILSCLWIMMFSGTHCKRRWQEPIVHSSLIPLDEYSNIRKFEYTRPWGWIHSYNFHNFLFNVGRGKLQGLE